MATPAVSVTKRAKAPSVLAGQPITFSIYVTNTGNVTLTATVEDKNNAQVGDGTLVAFGTDLGTISARSVTSGGVAIAHLTSAAPGVAHVTATTKGTGGAIQSTATVTYSGHIIFMPLVLRNRNENRYSAFHGFVAP